MVQGNNFSIKSTDTIKFISKFDIIKDKKAIHTSIVYDYRPIKDEKYCVHIIVSSNRLPYSNNIDSLAADLLKMKLLLNSIILDTRKGIRFTYLDIKDHFLDTPILDPKYVRV